MSYLQTIKYKKLPNGRKQFTEEVIASTPNAARLAIQNRLGVEISVEECLTSVPSSTFDNTIK
tara:strand:- start:431 stop:619 length:189 start_codon:yes stop_codon:yes gene_type:complete